MAEFWKWRNEVTDRVRFWTDWAEIARELTAHYEDHVKDLERLGYDRTLAEERSLAAMGDAEEVGRAMDKVHQPWLGWLWMASKWAAVAALAMLFLILEFNFPKELFFVAQREGDYEPDGFFYFSDDSKEREESVRVLHGVGETTVERGGDALSVPYAAAWRRTYALDDGQIEDDYWITIVLAADDRNPLDDALYDFIGELQVDFDDGRYYNRHYYDIPVGYEESGKVIWGPADGFLGGLGCYQSDPFRSLYQMWIQVEDPGAWMELSYPHGDSWSIRIDWEEVEP